MSKKLHKDLPVFLTKIYNIVESEAGGLVHWSENGSSFIIKEPKRFAKEVLPHHFKTANFNSFVRQLNFYGFRKINYEDNSTMSTISSKNNRSNTPTKSSLKHWEFYHINFLRDRKELLEKIKRKTYADSSMASKEELDLLREEVNERTALLESNTARMNKLEDMCEYLRTEISNIKSASFDTNINLFDSNILDSDLYDDVSVFDNEDTTLNNGLESEKMKNLNVSKDPSKEVKNLNDFNTIVPSSAVGNEVLLNFEDSFFSNHNNLKSHEFDGLGNSAEMINLDIDDNSSLTSSSPTSFSNIDLSSLAISEENNEVSVEVETPVESQKTLEKALSSLPENMNRQVFLDRLITTLSDMFPQTKEAYLKYQMDLGSSVDVPIMPIEVDLKSPNIEVTKEYAAAIMMACLLPQIQMALLTTVAASSVPTTAYSSLSSKL